MKVAIVLCLVFVSAFAKINDLDWDDYKARYNKQYRSQADEEKRYRIYTDRKAKILAHNDLYMQGKSSYYQGVNQFSDMTFKEVQATAMGFEQQSRNSFSHGRYHVPNFTAPLPDTVDWRTKNVVTPVKDQGGCGSCWAFSVTGALEGQHALATKTLVSLSEQNLVDCTKEEGNFGCSGGWPYDAYEYVIRVALGIDTEQSYPYKGVDQDCQFSAQTVGATSTAFAILSPGNETVLQEAVANVGPISVCIDASEGFMSYAGGVLDDPSCDPGFDLINHCVLAVGYGNDQQSGKDFWIVKNSWNTTFGEQGYIRMSRNNKNQCAISTLASYPDVKPTLDIIQ